MKRDDGRMRPLPQTIHDQYRAEAFGTMTDLGMAPRGLHSQSSSRPPAQHLPSQPLPRQIPQMAPNFVHRSVPQAPQPAAPTPHSVPYWVDPRAQQPQQPFYLAPPRRLHASGGDEKSEYAQDNFFAMTLGPTGFQNIRARVDSITWKQERNKKEATTLAVALDLLPRDGSVRDATEVLVRRLQALLCADEAGHWRVATFLESAMTAPLASAISPDQLKEAQRAARLHQATRGGGKAAKSSGSDSDDPRPQRRGKKGGHGQN